VTLRELVGTGPDIEISGLAYDNRAVAPGTLFFCVPGFTRDGHDFAADAIERGAAALVVQRPLGLGVPEVQVDDVRVAMAQAAARFFGDPTAQLNVIGITGTNGKTTTAFLVRDLLGRPCGLLGTVKNVVAGVDRVVVRTTPEAIELQRTFREMLDGGDEACAMEVSSHALELHRVDGVHFSVALFTNLTQDHLDFHRDMEAYFEAKRRLFEVAEGPRIVNADDEYGRRLPADVTFGIDSEADYRAVELEIGQAGCRFRALTPDGEFAVSIPLPGRFNVLNALGAWAAARALGTPAEEIAQRLPRAGRVPGRFEPVEAGQPFAVLVDYSHTPDSLENALLAAREVSGGRVICVFGCGGDRDRAKRPLMGEIACRLADLAIVTSDNPRSEDPEAIIAEVMRGCLPGTEAELDRRKAIFRAVGEAQPGDVVLIAGKGHEQGQEFENGRKEPFDDVTVAREALGR
jgi:UDP-N-acetylmuramoyl-L-alanyl-D-glutamate--2,6-diaminopimelate ligase